MNRPTSPTSPTRIRIPQTALAVLIALGAFGVGGAPGIAPTAAARSAGLLPRRDLVPASVIAQLCERHDHDVGDHHNPQHDG